MQIPAGSNQAVSGARCAVWLTALLLLPICVALLIGLPFVRRCDADANWQSCTCYTYAMWTTHAYPGVSCADWTMFTDGDQGSRIIGVIGEVIPFNSTGAPSAASAPADPMHSTHLGVDPTAQQLLAAPVDCSIEGASTIKCPTYALLKWLAADFYPKALNVKPSDIPHFDIMLLISCIFAAIGGLCTIVVALGVLIGWVTVHSTWWQERKRSDRMMESSMTLSATITASATKDNLRRLTVISVVCIAVLLVMSPLLAMLAYIVKMGGSEVSLSSSGTYMHGQFTAGSAAGLMVAFLALVVAILAIVGFTVKAEPNEGPGHLSINADEGAERIRLLTDGDSMVV